MKRRELASDRGIALAAGPLHARLKVLTHPALLVVDEIGYLPISRTGAMLLTSGVVFTFATVPMILKFSCADSRSRALLQHSPPAIPACTFDQRVELRCLRDNLQRWRRVLILRSEQGEAEA